MRSLLGLSCVALLLCVVGCGGGRVSGEFRPDEKLTAWDDSEWAEVLDQVATENGFVRWDQIENNTDGVRDKLFRHVGKIGAASPANRPDLFDTDEDVVAYYINAYNALCMYGVVKRGYPGNVLRPGFVDPGSLFFIDRFYVGGERMNLDTLEQKKLLDRTGRDPRLHFAVNCMSFSCPPLRQEPYSGEKLLAQLKEQGEIFLSDPRAVKRDDADTVRMNDIFTSFYRKDFVNDVDGPTRGDLALIQSVERFAKPDWPGKGATDVAGLGYQWDLNRPPAQWPPQD